MILETSNKHKIAEYERFGLGLNIKPSEDRPEILHADPDIIVAVKAFDCEIGTVVEDSILSVGGKELVDIKFMDVRKLSDGAEAIWTVRLGYRISETEVCIATSSTSGKINQSLFDEDAFGFDSIFQPDRFECSLYALDKSGFKDTISARRLATDNLVNCIFETKVKDSDLPPSRDWIFQGNKTQE